MAPLLLFLFFTQNNNNKKVFRRRTSAVRRVFVFLFYWHTLFFFIARHLCLFAVVSLSWFWWVTGHCIASNVCGHLLHSVCLLAGWLGGTTLISSVFIYFFATSSYQWVSDTPVSFSSTHDRNSVFLGDFVVSLKIWSFNSTKSFQCLFFPLSNVWC